MSKEHDDVAEDLALAKGGIPFLNVCLGPKWIGSGKTPRADLVVCSASYKGFVLSAFEVKISRSDFLRDLRSEKWRTYLPHCNRLYFAVLDEVCRKEDIPEEAGLLIRNNRGWYTAKKAPPLQSIVPYNTLKSLIFARQRRSAREKRIDDIMEMRRLGYHATDFQGGLKAARVHGKEVGRLLSLIGKGKNAIRDMASYIERHHQEIFEDIWKTRMANIEKKRASELCKEA